MKSPTPSRPVATYSRKFYKTSITRLMAALAAISLSSPLVHATNLYWDVNGTTAGFSTVVGAWDGSNNFWNSDITGGSAGSLTASTTAADDLFIKQATTNTGSITVTNGPSASSITFASNVGPTTTITGSTITIGGTGNSSGIFQQSTGANTISSGLILNAGNSAFNFSNSSAGLLTIGAITGAISSGTQTITVGSSSTGGITVGGIIADGSGGGNVALTVNSSGTGTTTLNGANTYTGATTITAGKLTIGSTGSLSSSSAVTVNSTTTSALTINAGGVVGGNVTVYPSSLSGSAVQANLVNSGTITGNLTINSSAAPAPILVQANTVVAGGATLNGGSSTSSGGTIKVDGQLNVAGSTAVITGTLTSTGTGNGASAGTGAINFSNSAGGTYNIANGSSYSYLTFSNGASVNLSSTGTVSLYSYGQGPGTTSAAFTTNINGGTWNAAQVGQNNSGKIVGGTTNILGGSTFNLAPLAANTWASSLGASQGGAYMHGIWNIGGASSGTVNITGGFDSRAGLTAIPVTGAINGLQFTVGNGGTLTTTTASSLGWNSVQATGQTTAQTTNSLTVNAGGSVTTAGTFTIANTTAQTATTTFNTLAVNGGTFSNSGGALYIGNSNVANTILETNTVNVAGGTLNQTGAAVSLGNSGTTATNYSNNLNISAGTMNVGTSASAQALQVGTSNTAASNTITNTVTLSGGKLVVSGLVSAFSGGNQTNVFNWTGGQLTAATITASTNFSAGSGASGGITQTGLVNFNGTLASGDIGRTGRTTINGNYTQNAGGTLHIDIGGTTASTSFQDAFSSGKFDQLIVTGIATLDGNLSLAFVDGFLPTIGNAFTLINVGGSSSIVGTFANAQSTYSILDSNNSYNFSVSYIGGTGNDLVLTLASISAVPEPSTYAALAGLGILGYTVVRRRRAV